MSDAPAPFLEVNFDGLIGPTHNYAGLSPGNIASTGNKDATSHPRKAALQGLSKMRHMLSLGLKQGLFLPHVRPNVGWLRSLGFTGSDEDVCRAASETVPELLRCALSASPMWTANAGTVSPAPDTADGRCHITVANLSTMLHRSMEPPQTMRQLSLAFADPRYFQLHAPLPAGLGDEGAANAMRLCASHAAKGMELFVYGAQPAGGFPARQHRAASLLVAHRHGIAPEDYLLIRQDNAAIASGAFHNDVVAVANENVLFTHEQAFQNSAEVYDRIRRHVPEAQIIEVPASRVSLAEAIQSYMFNSQLVTLPEGGMALVLPAEAREVPNVLAWLKELAADNGPITRLDFVEVRESMQNGGGPGCLRLRVPVDEAAFAAIDPRFLLDERKCDGIGEIVSRYWPERIEPADLYQAELWNSAVEARVKLLEYIGFYPEELL